MIFSPPPAKHLPTVLWTVYDGAMTQCCEWSEVIYVIKMQDQKGKKNVLTEINRREKMTVALCIRIVLPEQRHR